MMPLGQFDMVRLRDPSAVRVIFGGPDIPGGLWLVTHVAGDQVVLSAASVLVGTARDNVVLVHEYNVGAVFDDVRAAFDSTRKIGGSGDEQG